MAQFKSFGLIMKVISKIMEELSQIQAGIKIHVSPGHGLLDKTVKTYAYMFHNLVLEIMLMLL